MSVSRLRKAPILDSPIRDIFRYISSTKTISVMGAPFCLGQPVSGTDLGPEALRNAGLLSNISSLGWKVEDLGDFENSMVSQDDPDFINNIRNPRALGAVNKVVSERITEVMNQGKFPLLLGGDHSLGTGCVHGALRAHPDAAVLWIDAHADMNTVETTPSGNIHGMSLSWPLGLNPPDKDLQVPGYEWTSPPVLHPHSLYFLGLRDVDKDERRLIKEHGIHAYSMHSVDRYGIARVLDMILENIGRHRPIYVSWDIDSMDPSLMSATGTVVRGGLTFREGCYIMETLASTGQMIGMDVMEVNPNLEDRGSKDTVDATTAMVLSALGDSIL